MSESCMCDACVASRKRQMKAELAREREATADTPRVSDAELHTIYRNTLDVLPQYLRQFEVLALDLRDTRTALAERDREVAKLREGMALLQQDWATEKLRAEAAEARVRVLEEALRAARGQVITLHPARDPRSIEPRDMQDQVQIAVLDVIDAALSDTPKEEQRG